jgi:flagellar biosynthesis regulator FlaF
MQDRAQAYEQIPSADDPRKVEAWGLMKAATGLENACKDPENDESLREALRLNQVLWTIIQTAVLEDDCPLPPELRENVITLSVLVDRTTFSCLGDLDRDKVPFLINLNRQLAMGLLEGADAVESAPSAGPGPTPTRPAGPTSFDV